MPPRRPAPATLPDGPAPIPNRWTAFGLEDDPFFQEELGPRATDAYPVERYFVGRAEEVRALVARVGGARSSRTVVEGDAGVGKTSFVNRVKHDLAAHGVRTHEQPVRVTAETTLQTFVGDLLRVLLAMHAARLLGAGQARGAPAAADVVDAGLWAKITRVAEGQFLRTGGVGAAGFSVSAGATNVAPQLGGDLYHDEIRAAVRDLAGANGRLLLHVNNLENLRDVGTARAATLFRNLRDLLLIPGAHWLFVGRPGTAADVFQVHAETDSVMSEPVLLDPFAPEEVAALLERRYRELRRGMRFTAPVEPAAAAALYRRYLGDLRNFLRLLSTASERALHPDGGRPMTEVEVLAAVAPRYRARLARDLGSDDFDALRRTLAALVGEGGPTPAGRPTRARAGARLTRAVGPGLLPELRAADVAHATGLSRPAAGALVARLVAKRVLRPTRDDHTGRYHAVAGQVTVALESVLNA
ncbi:hypothetical protein tb265_40090 [Gemmatimonadetes bacterium T265]|nr:hypothetical protein tb265_40090 [Gemmatimonadetes bacterium T265]